MKNKWISVEDRLPNVHEEVWVYDEKGVTIGSCWISNPSRSIYWCGEGSNDNAIYGVTHWMKMDVPEPPQVESLFKFFLDVMRKIVSILAEYIQSWEF